MIYEVDNIEGEFERCCKNEWLSREIHRQCYEKATMRTGRPSMNRLSVYQILIQLHTKSKGFTILAENKLFRSLCTHRDSVYEFQIRNPVCTALHVSVVWYTYAIGNTGRNL